MSDTTARMTPVVLMTLPNANYMLGTFDTTNFRYWWRSKPFPDALQNIKKGFHIYGRTHLAIAQRTDGRWAVYRSNNYGIDWAGVFLGSAGEIIYDVVLITFGWAILNTSLGFYETVNSGVTWTLVLGLPSAPLAPAFCNIGGGDILMCSNGRYIWRSTNIARSWTLVCDLHNLGHFYGGYYRGPSNPCIVGANGRVWAANGPFLVRSDDGGLTFERISFWEVYWLGCPSTTILGHRLYDTGNQPLQSPKVIITELNIPSVDGPLGDDVVILVKLDDIVPVSGETQLFTYLFTSYSYAYGGDTAKNNRYKPVFQQYLSPTTSSQHIASSDVQRIGTNFQDRIAFSAQTKVVGGVSVPGMKYSIDGGITWIDIDINNLRIGNPEEGGTYQVSALEDNFAETTWVAGSCNNQGRYDFIELYRRQCQSYELSSFLERAGPTARQKIYSLGGISEDNNSKTESLDAIVETSHPKLYTMAAYNQVARSKSYRLARYCEAEIPKPQDLDANVSKDISINDSLDAVINGGWMYYRLAAFLKDKMTNPYQVDVIIEEYKLNERLADIERKWPQMMDIDLPYIPLGVYNSRRSDL